MPVLSWLALRGRCRDCAAPIAARYPLVELATGPAVRRGRLALRRTPYAAAALVVAAAGVALFMIDLDHRRLPFAITGAMAVGAVLALGIDMVRHGAGPGADRAGVAPASGWRCTAGSGW